MPNIQQIASEPQWLPHAIDMAGQRMQFLHIERATLSDTGFLADRKPASAAGEAWLPLGEVAAMALPQAAPNFIFHTAFCRSTLLVRALDIPGTSVGLGEPGIIAALANIGVAPGQPGAVLVDPVLRLLARPWGEGETVFVKPTNHANMLMPTLLRAAPQARAVLMTNGVQPFLASVLRKGMMGRRWARQLFLELQAYAGMDFGMDGREKFSMTDLQAGGLAWFLNQRWFAMHRSGQVPGISAERMTVLDGDRFNAQREDTLRSILDFVDQPVPASGLESIVSGPVFAQHAKLGGDFSEKEAQDAVRSSSPLNDQEIAQVAHWIDLIARQAGLKVPVEHSLF